MARSRTEIVAEHPLKALAAATTGTRCLAQRLGQGAEVDDDCVGSVPGAKTSQVKLEVGMRRLQGAVR